MCDATNEDGWRLHTGGTLNGPGSIPINGGQGIVLRFKNLNVLGTTISVKSNDGQSQSSLILPQATVAFKFTRFGTEPMGWAFDVDTVSDVLVASYCVYSTWIPGDPPNG